jgi:ribulose-5-phosphate 4-epimerase/fuculose-1-phosphate aldolase
MARKTAAAKRASATQRTSSRLSASKGLIEDLVAANRVLAQHGVVDAFGHISARSDRDPQRYLISVSRAPEIVTAADIVEFDLDSNPIRPDKRPFYTERFIHGQVYKSRPEVQSVVHSHSPSIVPFGVAGVPLQAVYHMAGFLCCGVPIFDIREKFGMTDMLVRNNDQGRALAEVLGERPVALMRGHGNVVAGTSIPVAVYRAIYTEVNAKLQQQVRGLGGTPIYLAAEEGALSDANNQRAIARPWELWKKNALRR